ncbi:MAG: fatty acid desaturase family protein [Bdellovibrionales bacterium]
MLALAAVIFSFSNNTLFSLLHECVHRAFSKNKQINEFFGTLTAAFFPTGFRLQRRFHMSHHRHNRTDSEMFDMYYIEDKRWLKNLQWYSIFTGVYWMSVPLAALIYLVWPSFYGHKFFQRGHALGDQTGSDEMFLSILQETRPFLTRIEILYSLLFQLSLFAILNYSFIPWLICHWIFGMNWGALQYADHAWSPRDVREGAWNLKVPRLVRWIFLNYHIHHAHHVYPQIPWYHLKKFEDSKMEKSFLDIYLQMWRGPKLTTDRRPKLLTNEEVEEMGVQ